MSLSNRELRTRRVGPARATSAGPPRPAWWAGGRLGGLVPPYLFVPPYMALLVMLGGCRPAEQIARYTVPKPELIDSTLVAKSGPPAAASRQEMLGAIIVAGDAGWFFKLTGDPESVDSVHDTFIAFVKSVNFAA